jgi:hypothetical protein
LFERSLTKKKKFNDPDARSTQGKLGRQVRRRKEEVKRGRRKRGAKQKPKLPVSTTFQNPQIRTLKWWKQGRGQKMSLSIKQVQNKVKMRS